MLAHSPLRRAFLTALVTSPVQLVAAPGATGCPTHRPAPAPPALIVLMDQTTELPKEVHAQFIQDCVSLSARWRRTIVAEFGGETSWLTNKMFDEIVSSPMSQAERERLRWELPPAEIQTDLSCRAEQQRRLDAVLRKGLQSSNGPKASSPVLEAIGEALRARRDGDPPPTLVLVSDSIQHYAPRSFYGVQPDSLRLPSPAALVDDLRRNGMLPDAKDVEVVHVGIGLAARPSSGPRLLRPGQEVQALKAVWSAVWAAAGAKRWTFGEPLPVDGLVR